MKYLFSVLLFVILLIFAGCISESKSNVVTTTVQITQIIPTSTPLPEYHDIACYNTLENITTNDYILLNGIENEHNQLFQQSYNNPIDPSHLIQSWSDVAEYERESVLEINLSCTNLYDHNITVAAREFKLYYGNVSQAASMRKGTYDQSWAEANIIANDAWNDHGSIAFEDLHQYYMINNSVFEQHQYTHSSYSAA